MPLVASISHILLKFRFIEQTFGYIFLYMYLYVYIYCANTCHHETLHGIPYIYILFLLKDTGLLNTWEHYIQTNSKQFVFLSSLPQQNTCSKDIIGLVVYLKYIHIYK